MFGNHEEFPANIFSREHPFHALRARQAVDRWYITALGVFMVRFPDYLQQTTGMFLDNAGQHPENVYINEMPLVFALKPKRDAFIKELRDVNPSLYMKKFLEWYYDLVVGEASIETSMHVKNVATLHIYHWLGTTGRDLQQHPEVWDAADEKLEMLYRGTAVESDEACEQLLVCIHGALVEQFISENYAPGDLFGASQMKPI